MKKKEVTRYIGMKGHFWHWDWKWGTVYGYTDDTYTVPCLRMTYRGPLVFFEI